MIKDYSIFPADITWKSDKTPASTRFDDVYFSREDGRAETHYVFLQQNGLPERWKSCGASFTIAETGFGTGLNFLETLHQWRLHAPKETRLHYISVEQYPLTPAQLRDALAPWAELEPEATALLAVYPLPVAGTHHALLDDGNVTLTLLFGEASLMFAGLELDKKERGQKSESAMCPRSGVPIASQETSKGTKNTINAWYLDGFAPAKNPDMWSESLFKQMARLSGEGTTFATFTAAGFVKRGLRAAGFTAEKCRGYGYKRDMLAGAYLTLPLLAGGAGGGHAHSATSVRNPPPPNLPRERGRNDSTLIIGGGIAGCSAAYALAKRGCRVILIERHQQLAHGASGNASGALFPQLEKSWSPLPRFTLQGFAHSVGLIKSLWKHGADIGGALDGMVYIGKDDDHAGKLQAITEILHLNADIAGCISQMEASELAGIALPRGGVFLPHSGWICVPQLCAALVQHPNICVQTEQDALSLTQDSLGWSISTRSGHTWRAEQVIIANAIDCEFFTPTSQLPLIAMHGQISHLPASALAGTLKRAVCHSGYLTPAADGIICGATYDKGRRDSIVTAENHRINIEQLAGITPVAHDVAALTESAEGRASFRTTTPDRMPVIGAVPDPQRLREVFQSQFFRGNVSLHDAEADIALNGLYITVGHGSRGLVTAPLAAEFIAAQICGEPLPLAHDLITASHAGRFLLKELRRG